MTREKHAKMKIRTFNGKDFILMYHSARKSAAKQFGKERYIGNYRVVKTKAGYYECYVGGNRVRRKHE